MNVDIAAMKETQPHGRHVASAPSVAAKFDVVTNCITIRGSFVRNRREMAEVIAFAADGKVKADFELQPLPAINKVFGRLTHGDVPSRVVLDFSKHLIQSNARRNLIGPQSNC